MAGLKSATCGAVSLVELLVVISTLSILAALLLPVTRVVEANTQAAKCASNLRQIGVAMHLYANEHDGMFPVVYPAENSSWRTKLIPYLGMASDSMGVSPLPAEAGVFVCPSFRIKPKEDSRARSYQLNAKMTHLLPVWGYSRLKVKPSATIMVVEYHENTEQYIQWDAAMAAKGIARDHPGHTANYLFVDGHVEKLGEILAPSDPRWFTPAQ